MFVSLMYGSFCLSFAICHCTCLQHPFAESTHFFPPLPIHVHLMSVLNPSLSSLTSADTVDDRMGEIEIHDDVVGRLDVGGEDIANREIGEKTRTSR